MELWVGLKRTARQNKPMEMAKFLAGGEQLGCGLSLSLIFISFSILILE